MHGNESLAQCSVHLNVVRPQSLLGASSGLATDGCGDLRRLIYRLYASHILRHCGHWALTATSRQRRSVENVAARHMPRR